ncbi:MAG TPA: alanine racemase [Acidobacteriaceae bacterium]
MSTRPVWAEVSLERLRGNLEVLRRSVAEHWLDGPPDNLPELLAVVKADAYGHGVTLCGPALAAAGARWLGVTSVEEGCVLRRALGVLPSHLSATRILVMSGVWHGEADAAIDHGLTAQVWERFQLELLHQAASRRGLPAGAVSVHLEIDTGMARQGVAPGRALAELLEHPVLRSGRIAVDGVMTHFSAAERLLEPETEAQILRFSSALGQLAGAGIVPRWVHAGNSATVFSRGQCGALQALAEGCGARLMLRPGLALYGYAPRTIPAQEPGGLEPVLSWKTRIVSLRELGVGQGAGYNSIFRATRPTRLALTPVGYGDGLNRMLSGLEPSSLEPSSGSAMLVRGERARVAGRISMDQTMLDVTDIRGVAIGDEVAILGEQSGPAGAARLTAWEHADLCGTIPYEVLCRIAARVPRVVVG